MGGLRHTALALAVSICSTVIAEIPRVVVLLMVSAEY
jgi:hypothetical protein